MKLATHDSATGEKPINLLGKLGIIFARTLFKTIQELYNIGVRMFDIRCKIVNKEYRLAHGLSIYNKTLKEILTWLSTQGEKVYILLTYEGKLNLNQEKFFLKDMQELANLPNIIIHSINIKLSKWKTLWANTKDIKTYSLDYTKIVGWKVLLPIPWLWYKISKFPISNKDFSMRDFV